MGPLLASTPAIASSPPAGRSLATTPPVTIRRSRASSTGGGNGSAAASLSYSRTPVSAFSAASTPNGKPPIVPVPAAVQQVGFFVDMERAPSLGNGAMKSASPSQQTSLLSRALSSELVAPSLVSLFGTVPAPGSLAGLTVTPVTVPVDVPVALLEEAQARNKAFLQPLVVSAYHVAARAHAGQRRKNGDPTLRHCMETAMVVAELGLPSDLVAAALLADVLSDTTMTEAQLEEHVPHSVVETVRLVTQLSDISQLYRDNTHSLEAEAVLTMLTSMSDVGALLIKLAGRLHNMRTIDALPRCKQVRVATETLEVFSVLANRLGAWTLRAELEDLAFKTLHPEEYAEVAAAVQARAGGANAGLEQRATELKAALEAAGLRAVDVSGRAKNLYGVWKKAQKSGQPVGEVYDLLALRVVVPAKHDCYAALRVVDGLWRPVAGRCKDYIREPKANGYQSLHTTVRMASGAALEVQIRTPKMHYIAEYGFAAHWRYKEKLGREDLWLDRLVQWKKWVATKKLGIADGKVRPAGSSAQDQALAALGVQFGGSPAGSSSRQAAARSPFAAGAETAGALEEADGTDPLLRNVRFRVRDITGDAAVPVTVLVSGARGVRAELLPAGTTVGQFMSGLSLHEAASCELSVNGVEMGGSPSRRLCSGDKIELVPRRAGSGGFAPPTPVQRSNVVLAPLTRRPVVAPAAGGASDLLDVYVAGQAAPVEVALERKLRLSTMQLRLSALAS